MSSAAWRVVFTSTATMSGRGTMIWRTMVSPNSKIEWIIFLRSEEHTSELQSQSNLVCRLLLEKKKPRNDIYFVMPRRYYQYDRPRIDVHAHVTANLLVARVHVAALSTEYASGRVSCDVVYQSR